MKLDHPRGTKREHPIRAWRRRNGFLQFELAEAAKVSVQTLNTCERGGSPRWDTMVLLAEAMRIPVEDLARRLAEWDAETRPPDDAEFKMPVTPRESAEVVDME